MSVAAAWHCVYSSQRVMRSRRSAHLTGLGSVAKLAVVCSQMVRFRPMPMLAMVSVQGHKPTAITSYAWSRFSVMNGLVPLVVRMPLPVAGLEKVKVLLSTRRW